MTVIPPPLSTWKGPVMSKESYYSFTTLRTHFRPSLSVTLTK